MTTEQLIEGRWYWVWLLHTHPDPHIDDSYKDPCDGWDVAKHDTKAAGGWRNGDWEDFGRQVYCWRLIPLPDSKPPSLAEQALLAIDTAVADNRISAEIARVTRAALERLQELEKGNE